MMIPELKEILHLFEKLIDGGATYATIQAKIFKTSRCITWSSEHHHEEKLFPHEYWALRVLCAGHWGVVTAPSFEDLQSLSPSALLMALSSSQTVGYSKNTQGILNPKPIRQMRFEPSKDHELQNTEDLLLEIQHISELFDHPIRSEHREQQVQSYFWDSEHSRGASEYINQSLTIIQQAEENVESDIHLHHVQALPLVKDDDHGQRWHKELKRWANTLSLDDYSGPSPEDFCWIFSHRAFAQLVQKTLGPTLCLERPDPFVEAMNPSALNGTMIAPEFLTIYSQPSLFKASSFLDEEGVPVRQLPLVESGVLSNFVMTRSSSHQLSRSLPVHKEKYLAGAARISAKSNTCYPDLKYTEVSTGESLGKDFRLSHLYINDVDIKTIDGAKFEYLITAKNVLVNKFSGMHKRHIRRLQFQVNRDQLWGQLMGVGRDALTVSLPAPNAKRGEAYSVFSTPMAKFRGLPCIWR
jgi:hypothetical protein